MLRSLLVGLLLVWNSAQPSVLRGESMTYTLKDSQTTDNDFWTNGNGGRTYLGTSFTAGSSYTLHRVELKLNILNSPVGPIYCDIYNDDGAGLPNVVLGTATNTVDSAALPTTADYSSRWEFTGLALTSGTKYHIVIHGTGTNNGYGAGGGVQWRDNTGGAAGQNVSTDLDGVAPFSVVSASSQGDFNTYFNDAAGGAADPAAQQPRVGKPLTLLRGRPLGPSNPLREVRVYEIPSSSFNSGPITVTPDVGSLVLDGLAPTIQLSITVAPGLGQLQLDGFAPSIGLPINLTPGLGALILTGLSPTIGLPITVTPGLGQLILNGQAPTIQLPINLQPGAGQLILTGLAPSIGLPVSLRPALGQLTLSGFAPAIGLPINLQPALGQLILSGFSPTVGLPVTLRPGLAQLILDGFNPLIISGGVTVQPGMGQAILTGFAPSITLPVTLKPGLGALTLAGLVPTIGLPIMVRPGVGLLVLTGFEPTIVVIGSSETMALIGVLNTFPKLSGVTDAFTELTGQADAFVRLTGSTDAFVALDGRTRALVALTGIILLYPEEG